MRVIEHITDMKAIIRSQKAAGKSIGFVPTMGYLHEGHLSLVRECVQDNEFTVMSIFVNPTQFGANEDFGKYPRNMERDCRLAEKAGVDVVFAPTVDEMYPKGYHTYINVEGITQGLCGKSRPTHFRGVATVVAKLFNIVEAEKAYFGQKDAQQVAVIQRMVQDLNMNIEIIPCPIVRENDGLALSSRNVYLNSEERKAACVLSKALFEAREQVGLGERNMKSLKDRIKNRIQEEKLAAIDYVEIVDPDTMEELETIDKKALVALAVKFSLTRLIDNIVLEV